MTQKRKIILIIIAVVVVLLIGGYFVFKNKKVTSPDLKAANNLTEEEIKAQQEEQRIKTVTGVSDEEKFKPMVEGEVITGVSTGSKPQVQKSSPPPPSSNPIGSASSDIQGEIDALRNKQNKQNE